MQNTPFRHKPENPKSGVEVFECAPHPKPVTLIDVVSDSVAQRSESLAPQTADLIYFIKESQTTGLINPFFLCRLGSALGVGGGPSQHSAVKTRKQISAGS